MTDIVPHNVVHTIPHEFLVNSVLVNCIKQRLISEKGAITTPGLISALSQQMQQEPNPILVDIYRQIIGSLR